MPFSYAVAISSHSKSNNRISLFRRFLGGPIRKQCRDKVFLGIVRSRRRRWSAAAVSTTAAVRPPHHPYPKT